MSELFWLPETALIFFYLHEDLGLIWNPISLSKEEVKRGNNFHYALSIQLEIAKISYNGQNNIVFGSVNRGTLKLIRFLINISV